MTKKTTRKVEKHRKDKNGTTQKSIPTHKKGFDTYFRLALLAAVGVLLFYPPYFRGLFFATEMLTTHVATTAVFLLWSILVLRKKDVSLNIGLLDWLVLCYAVIYCLSIIGAVDTRQAMSGALKALNYGLIYFLVAKITLDLRMFKNWLVVLYVSSVGVALVGIGCATGYVSYPAGFDGQNITSTLQYVNATSAYMAIMVIIGVTLALNAEKIWSQIFYSFTASLLILVSISAISKGAWAIFILALILFLAGMPGPHRLKSVYFFIITLIAGLASSHMFMLYIQNEQPIHALVSLGSGLGIVIIAKIIWQGMVRFYQTQGTLKTAVLSIFGVALAVVAGWTFIGHKAVTAFGSITEEMAQLTDLQGSSFVSRWAMYVDAAQIIKDNPLLGTGAGGWNLLYHQYQDFLYWTTEVHNHLLQVGVETGIPGMLIWLGLFIALAYYIYRIKKSGIDDQGKVLVWGVGTAIFALGAHSLIDFDLSIPSLQILFFTLLGLMASAFRAGNLVNRPKSNRVLWAGVGVSVVLFLFSGSLITAMLMWNQGAKMVEAGNYERVLIQFQKASMFDPFNSQYQAAQARIYAQLYASKAGGESLTPRWYSSAVHHAVLAELKSPYDALLMSELSGTYGLLGSSEDAIRLYERVVKLNPWDINAYNNLATVYANRAILHLEAGDLPTANKYLELVLMIPDRINQQAAKVSEDLRPMWSGAPLAPDSTTTYIIAQAHYYQGEYQVALQEFERLLGESFVAKDEFKILYAAALHKNGREAEAEQVMAEFKIAKPDVYSRYLKIRELPTTKKG